MTKAKPKDAGPELFGEVAKETRVVIEEGHIKKNLNPPPTGKRPPPPKSQAVAKVEPLPVIAVTDFQATLRTLETLATRKDVNVEVADRVVALMERMQDRAARQAFDAAFVEMQPKLPVMTKDGKIVVDQGKPATGKNVRGTWAKWETVDPILKPILQAHGFGLSHRTSSAPDGRIRVTAILRGHGHVDDGCYMDGVPDTSGGKNAVQATASTVSYMKRHTALAVLNVVTREEDDDGQGAGGPVVPGGAIAPEQADQLVELREAVECPADKFLAHLNKTKPASHPKIDKLADLPASRFDEAIAALRSYETNAKERTAKTKPAQQGAQT
jgi:hypothetical protein